MEPSTPTDDRAKMALAFGASLLVNVGWFFVAPGDQRIIVLALLSVVAGLVALTGDDTGAYGIGIIVGAMLAGFVGLGLVALGLSPS
jgi:hypothetical protein